MNKNFTLFSCILGSLCLSACVTYSPYEEGQPVDGQSAETYCVENDLDANCKSQFTNYTNVATNYRQYGERSPRDITVSQSGAGNNMSAALPPSIENEITEYENNNQNNVDTTTSEVSSSESNSNNNNTTTDEAEDWVADEGQNLKDLLSEWSERAGWRLVWDTNRNYTLTAGAMFRGSFADVSSALIRAFARAKPAPIATFYKGNRVLVVETMEDENAY